MTRLRRLQPVNTVLLAVICSYFIVPLWWLAVSTTKTQGELVLDSGLFSVSDQFLANLTRLLARENGAYWSVLLPSLVSPLGVYLARVSIDAAVPDEIVEAAHVDGAGGLRTFASIALPLMGPGLLTIFLFQFVAIWNNFMLPLIMLNDSRMYPVTLGLYNWNGQFIQDPSLATSVLIGAFVSIIPVIVGFLMLQRFWSTGLTAGGVKS